MLDCSRQHLVNEVYSAVLLYIANWTANLAFALSEAKTKSSVCPAHMSVCPWELEIMSQLKFLTVWHPSVTFCCLCYLAWLLSLSVVDSSPPSLSPWLKTVPRMASASTFSWAEQPKLCWVTASLTAAAPGVCPPLPPPAPLARPSVSRERHLESLKDMHWQPKSLLTICDPTALSQGASLSREAIGTS